MGDRELTVTVQGNEVVARASDGGEASGRLELDSAREDLLKLFADWLRRDRIRGRRELEICGSHLYWTLFGQDVGGFLDHALKEATREDRLRLQLSFGGREKDLAGLPWEFLYYPDSPTRTGFFFATRVEMVLSRYMPLSSARRPLRPEQGPLRLLIAASRPRDRDLGLILDGPVIESIQGLANRLPIRVEVLKVPTIDNLLEALQATRPHIFHYIGHGRFNAKTSQGEIALLGPDEQSADWRGDRLFAEVFEQAGATPNLVVLHACEGAAVDFTLNYAGLAPQLIRHDVQAVVAMQYPIENRAGITFVRAFYKELAAGQPVDVATQVGRWRLAIGVPDAYESRVFGTPVLYMRSREALILPMAGSSSAPLEGSGPGGV